MTEAVTGPAAADASEERTELKRAVLGPLRERGDLTSRDEVVGFDCGSGHKAAPPPKLSL